MATSTDLVLAGEKSNYQLLRLPPDEVRDLITGNLQPGEHLTPSDLRSVKIPTGGMTKWVMQTIRGEQVLDELRGVIIRVDPRRAYWREAYKGGNDAPDCFSDDGLHGVGEPGGLCAACPLNQFLDEPDDRGSIAKPCKELRQLYMLTPDGLLPIVINIPPGSLKTFREYRVGLMDAGLNPQRLETVIRLTKVKSQGGIDYAQATFSAGADLDPTAQALVDGYAADLAPALERVRREQPLTRDAAQAA